MICQNCGKEIPEGACVCINCGVNAPTPAQVKAANPVPGKGLGIASMILGIVSIVFLCCIGSLAFPFPIAGLITGIIAMNQSKKAGAKNGMALAGIICSIIALVFVIISVILLVAIGVTGGLSSYMSY